MMTCVKYELTVLEQKLVHNFYNFEYKLLFFYDLFTPKSYQKLNMKCTE